MIIRKAGCYLEVTEDKYNNYYKRMGYKAEIDISDKSYKELQELYSEHFKDSPMQKKEVLIEKLKEVL